MFTTFRVRRQAAARWIVTLTLVGLVLAGAATYSVWRPALVGGDSEGHEGTAPATKGGAKHSHADADHGHSHKHGDDSNKIELSKQAQQNIGLRVGPVALQSYQRSVTIPGMIVERPGRTSIAVAAPLSGVIARIFAVAGEAVSPGQRLFEVRLTHEEIVQAQGEFLKTVAEIDVTGREVKRLETIAAEGAIPGKAFLELRYEQEKLEAALNAQREALLLHGLSEEQVTAIQRDRKLLQGLTVYAPPSEEASAGSDPVWQIQELNVSTGQHVDAGETLAVLTDYRTLFIQGTAFEQDTLEIQSALVGDLPIAAVMESSGAEKRELSGLKIAYTSGRVDPGSRTFNFYVTLPNPLVRDATNPDGHRFVDWQFKPGQRVMLRVPVETWENSLVLPVGAVAREGAESYVFQANGNTFMRRPVHEKHRDQLSVVIANDGSIFPGDHIALSGGQQLQIAIKNKSSGGMDPHAGHNH